MCLQLKFTVPSCCADAMCGFLHFPQGYMGGTLFIATQMPLPDTTVDFWRMVYDYKCKTAIMLNTIGLDDKVKTTLCL